MHGRDEFLRLTADEEANIVFELNTNITNARISRPPASVIEQRGD